VNESYQYDAESDVLEVYFGEKRAAWTIELTEHIMLSVDRQSKQAVALLFLDFSLLTKPTPLGARSFPLTGLADLPASERELVVQVLMSPSVKRWLDVSTVYTLPDSPFSVTHLVPPAKPLAFMPVLA